MKNLISVFESNIGLISSESHNLASDDVLSHLTDGLIEVGFVVETGKSASQKVPIPVLFGMNGTIEKSFYADAFHADEGVVLEVEAGRAVDNNQFLKDLFQACMMQDAIHLVVAVRNDYRNSDDFSRVVKFFDTLYASQRLHLPLKSVLIIGY